MFTLEMFVRRGWEAIGSFDTQDEAKFCCFDSRYNYRVLDSNGNVIFEQKKTASSFRDCI